MEHNRKQAESNPVDDTGWAHTQTPPEIYGAIKHLAREKRAEPTPAEDALWQRIRKNQIDGYKFRRQHPIDRFIVDFYCPQARLVIEVDGPIHDYTPEEDAARQQFIESLGLRVLRFTNDWVLYGIDAVLAQIRENIPTPQSSSSAQGRGATIPTPQPPPHRNGEGESGKSSGRQQVGEGESSESRLTGSQAEAASTQPSQPTAHESQVSPQGTLPSPIAMGEGQGVGDKFLDGKPVPTINADLTAEADLTQAKVLTENEGMAFQGPGKVGAFDIPNNIAQSMLVDTNITGKSNKDVVKPYMNGDDIVKHNRMYWIIDFGSMSEKEAASYLMPFKYLEENVKEFRSKNRDLQRKTYWWRLGRSGEEYRSAVAGLSRQVLTSQVAKHRIFAWHSADVMPANTVIAIAREDDYFFGVLHSYLHEIWSLRMGTWLGKGNDPRYTPTTTFETFPFPWSPGKEDTDSPAHQAISAAAQQLHEERHEWLNPSGAMLEGPAAQKLLRARTLTNLYNALVDYRELSPPLSPLPNALGRGSQATPDEDSPPLLQRGRGKGWGTNESSAAAVFAPRLMELHDALDRAVLAAYGWDDLWGKLRTPEGDEDLLRRLLALNLERAENKP